MKFEYVPQEHDCGCSAACIAMALGVKYQDVVKHFRQDFDRQGLTDREVGDYIGDHGFSLIRKTAHCFMDIQSSNEKMMQPFADIHIVSARQFINSKMGHSFVMDSKGAIFDPENKDAKSLDRYYSIDTVLGFFDERKKIARPKRKK